VGASERWLFYDLTTAILNCITTTLGTNYNYTFKAVFAGMAVRQRILTAPGQFQKYLQQVSGLVGLVNTIRRNPSLRSPEVHRLLSQISLSLAAAQKSLESLQKRGTRAWRIRWQFKIASGTVQKSVVDHLDDLDRTIWIEASLSFSCASARRTPHS
jgi:hypothetical protein